MRRALEAALSACGATILLIAGAGPASAHGLGGRLDLPVPRTLFIYGATLALVVSFVLLSALWKEPRFESGTKSRVTPAQGLLGSPVVGWTVRISALAFFLLVMMGALGGSRSRNIAPVVVWVWFWVGLAFVHALLGNWWATLSPWDTLARLLGIEEGRRPYPSRLGKWPAVAVLFVFVWTELTAPWGPSARPLGFMMIGYSVLTLSGMAVFGRKDWNENGEAFAVYFGLFARIAPLARDGGGRVVLRAPLAGLATVPPGSGLAAFVVVMLGSTVFDGASRLAFWSQHLAGRSRGYTLAASSVGLVVVVLLVRTAYELAISVSASLARSERSVLSARFVHSLVPIALAYVVAHYFSFLLIEGQQGLSAISDPFGLGWNLFGTAAWRLNLNIVSVNTIWYVEVFAIVAGHVGGVILAHDRAVAMWEPKLAVRTQYTMLAVMVLFTAMGLFILSGG